MARHTPVNTRADRGTKGISKRNHAQAGRSRPLMQSAPNVALAHPKQPRLTRSLPELVETAGMTAPESTRHAQLVASIHSPWRATVAECLARWARLDAADRDRAFLVLDGAEPEIRHTLNGRQIADLAARMEPLPRLAA